MKIKIAAKSAEAFAELRNTKTAAAIIKSLPFESTAHRWGDEIYFDIPVKLGLENVVLDISVLLDEFITGPNDNYEELPGSCGEQLHDWI